MKDRHLRWKERKKERHAPEANEKMKNELPQVGFEPTTLCTPDRVHVVVTCVCVHFIYIIIITIQSIGYWLFSKG